MSRKFLISSIFWGMARGAQDEGADGHSEFEKRGVWKTSSCSLPTEGLGQMRWTLILFWGRTGSSDVLMSFFALTQTFNLKSSQEHVSETLDSIWFVFIPCPCLASSLVSLLWLQGLREGGVSHSLVPLHTTWGASLGCLPWALPPCLWMAFSESYSLNSCIWRTVSPRPYSLMKFSNCWHQN